MLAMCLSTQIIAQEDGVEMNEYEEIVMEEEAPKQVHAVLLKMYPNTVDVIWQNDVDRPNVWLAEFEDNGQMLTVFIDDDGNWIETLSVIEQDKMPKTIAGKLQEAFEEYELLEGVMVSDKSGDSYRLYVLSSSDGLEYMVTIDSKGQLSKEEAVIETPE